MHLKLNIYTDETMLEVKRVAEADSLKIPYRVAKYVAESLENINIKNEDELFKFVINSIDKIDKIVKATFGVTEDEFDCINIMELGSVAVEVYKWAIGKFGSLKGGHQKNVAGAV